MLENQQKDDKIINFIAPTARREEGKGPTHRELITAICKVLEPAELFKLNAPVSKKQKQITIIEFPQVPYSKLTLDG